MSVSKSVRSKLMKSAKKASLKAYAPYSKFFVGAAVLTDKGVFTGCNVENASYGLTICAERVAITAAISHGATKIKAVAISVQKVAKVPPCGLCLQTMAEFASDNLEIFLDDSKQILSYKLSDLLPVRFKKKMLAKV